MRIAVEGRFTRSGRRLRGSPSYGRLTRLDRPTGLADADCARGQILHHDRSRTHHAQLPDRHPWTDNAIGPPPRIFPNDNWQGNQRHVPTIVVMGAGAKVAVLADIGAALQRDWREVVERDVASDHRPRGEGELPGKGDFDGRENHHVRRFRNVGAKEPEQENAPEMERARAPAKQRRLDKRPQPAQQNFTARMGGDAILTEVGGFCHVSAGVRRAHGGHFNVEKSSSSRSVYALKS